MALQPISTPHGARKLMQRLIEAGRCTLEDFDTPPPGNLNPAACQNLLREPEQGETVTLSDTRDYSPQPGITPAEAPPLPVTLEASPAPLAPPDVDLGIDW